MKGLRIDAEQHSFTLLDLFRMRGEIGGREHAPGGDLGDGAEAALVHLDGHDFELLAAFVGESSGGIAEHQFGDALGMCQRESKRDRAAKTVADQDRVIRDLEFVETCLLYTSDAADD